MTAYLVSSLLPLAAIMTCLAAWMSVAVFNNIVDPSTNRMLLGGMLRMDLVREDPHLGNGLQHRAMTSPEAPVRILRIVIVVQLVLAALLWTAAATAAAAWLGLAEPASAVAWSNLALILFNGLWAFFLCGGLWFGYWIKLSHVQQVHMTLLIIGILAFILAAQVDIGA